MASGRVSVVRLANNVLLARNSSELSSLFPSLSRPSPTLSIWDGALVSDHQLGLVGSPLGVLNECNLFKKQTVYCSAFRNDPLRC